ncbi:hypothetical protein Tco_0921955 [Tanacetum coccineum]|uniref:Retroviral polymerase SH3-like domain-containing protein n=1 Tax=Tanacetum coccineum TaxID=301880 RepID=A0ABQ5CWR6_9ASTR
MTLYQSHRRLRTNKGFCSQTAEEIVAREERENKDTLLMALPEDHLAKFHKMTDAKEMWDAIKSRFWCSKSLSRLEIHVAGVSTEDANQKFLRSLPSAWSQVSLIMRTKPGVDSLSFDDLYNNLRVFEKLMNITLKNRLKVPKGHDLNENEKVLPRRLGLFARECRIKGNQDNRRRDAWNSGTKDGSRTGQKEDSKALVTIDGEGVDWTNHSEDEDYALMLHSSDSDYRGYIWSKTTQPSKSESQTSKIGLPDYPHRALQNKGIIDSGCSRHMTRNKAYLAEFQDFNGGPVAFEYKFISLEERVNIKTDLLGVPCNHLNTLTPGAKFAGKSDEGFLVGYSLQSKAFRVYNLETKRVEENLHITFLENKPNVAGKGPTWLFDLDYLTDSMNYHPVRSENQANIHAGQQEANHHAGIEDIIDAGDSEKEDASDQDCFVLLIWPSYSSTISPDLKTYEKKEGPREEEQVFLVELERLKRQEKEANKGSFKLS